MQANDAAIKLRQNSQLVEHGAALPNMLKSKFLRPELTLFMKGNTMKNDPLAFLADALQTQEIVLHALLKSLQKFNPAITADLISSLDHVMKNAQLLPAGVHQTLGALLGDVRATQPKQPPVH